MLSQGPNWKKMISHFFEFEQWTPRKKCYSSEFRQGELVPRKKKCVLQLASTYFKGREERLLK